MNNYHLLIVHFPIVFAMMYGLVEVISFFKKNQNAFLHECAGWTTLLGTISIFVAQATGEAIEHGATWSTQQKQMIEVHSTLSGVLLTIFIIGLVGYAIDWTLTNKELFRNYFANKQTISKLLEIKISIFTKVQPIVSSRQLRFLLGIASVLVVTAIGALGGAVATGCATDPATRLICTFF